MERVSEALQKALDCLSQATKTQDADTREELAQMARHWMRLAVELSEQISTNDRPGSPG